MKINIMESLRILWILLYKIWLVRKRHWISSLIVEVILPILTILCLWSLTGFVHRVPKYTPDKYYQARSVDSLMNNNYGYTMYYAPNSSFTDTLMSDVRDCFNKNLKIQAFVDEADLIDYYRNNSFSYRNLAVVFDKSVDYDSKQLNYKIRTESYALNDLYQQDFGLDDLLTDELTESYPFVQTQVCLDKSFIKMTTESENSIPEMFIQRIPSPGHYEQFSMEQYFIWMYVSFFAFAFMFPLLTETARATNEKFAGINVLMSMNGISNTLNILSWTIGGFLMLTIFVVLPNVWMLTSSSGSGLAFLHYGNTFILFLVFALYSAHILTCAVHFSAYFSKAVLVTVVLLIVTVLPIVLMILILTDDNLYLAPYLGILLPNILLFQAVVEIRSYESIGEGISWSNIFASTNSTTGITGGLGMILIMFLVGIIVHFSLSIYVYAIKPGKYGVGKHPLFFLMCNKSKDEPYSTLEDLAYDDFKGAHFEPVPAGAYTPGIRIRNLTKAYNINIFSRQKVRALRGVSVDFYKGQITSLLGHNGAGKTTMMSIMTGMISPSRGTVLVNSKNLKDNPSEIMKDMGLCTQENLYFTTLSVSEQLLLLAKVKGKNKSSSQIRRDVNTLLDKLKLFDKRNDLPNTLSGGQKRRLCLGMALVGDSSTLILDEPTSGLDPESRRVIWDILLKMRGQKTILISTHDMEEADILGDRIAIMHTGQLKSYGTSLFLKKMIGQNNVEVTLSIEPHSDPEKIRSELHSEGMIVSKETSKMTVSIPNSSGLPDSLDNLEEKKKELGVSGFSVSLISLEQVFLKTTYENDEAVVSQRVITGDDTKLQGCALNVQILRGLFCKHLSYTMKDFSTILIEILTIVGALLIVGLIFKGTLAVTKEDSEAIWNLELDKYSHPEVMFTNDEQSIGDQYKSVCEKFSANCSRIVDTNLQDGLMRRGKEDDDHYRKHMIAAAEFKETANGKTANAFYSVRATFSLLISINLIWNAVIKKLLGSDYSISLSTQRFPNNQRSFLNDAFQFTYLNGYGASLVFAFIFYYAIAMFVIHPLRESITGVKHLQKMTGTSGLAYWATTFLFDLMIFAVLIVVVVVGFAFIDYSLDLGLYTSNDIWIMVLLLILLAVNALPLMYIFSFIQMKTNTAIRFLTNIPIGIVIFDLVMMGLKIVYSDTESVKILRSIQKSAFLLFPYESFTHTLINFQMATQTNARCKRLPNEYYETRCGSGSPDPCCEMECYNGTCKKFINFFTHEEITGSSKESLTYLYIMPFVYFVILALMEYQLIQKIRAKFRHDYVEESIGDEQVRREKTIIYQKLKSLDANVLGYANTDNIINGRTSFNGESSGKSNDQVFLVYELQKSYNELRAVKDVSFGVERQECFGLLGVNGAGKSTTFRMMTGGEIPDHGVMYIGDKDFENHEKYFLSQVGYCPQNDALLKCLNCYDHLRLFARLRGIPENQVENEVEAWIQRLNLRACALQPSGTYSGGNKRRLNIAMALIGNPSLVFMDEPTTGVDPGARRSLWNVIKACQLAGQAVVLTSHSMEECEALCNRLAIMVDGKLVCIGASEQLKQRFGAGYDIQVKMDVTKAKEQLDSIKSDMPRMLNCVLTDENLGNLMYHVAPAGTTWRKMYDVMYEMKNKYDSIDDFLVLSSSLEQLFLLFARTANGRSTAS